MDPPPFPYRSYYGLSGATRYIVTRVAASVQQAARLFFCDPPSAVRSDSGSTDGAGALTRQRRRAANQGCEQLAMFVTVGVQHTRLPGVRVPMWDRHYQTSLIR